MAELAKRQCKLTEPHEDHYWMSASDAVIENLPNTDGVTYRMSATWVDTMCVCEGIKQEAPYKQCKARIKHSQHTWPELMLVPREVEGYGKTLDPEWVYHTCQGRETSG